MTQTLEQLSAAATKARVLESRVNNRWQITLDFGSDKDAMRKFSDAYRTGQLVAVSDDGERPYLCSTHNQRYGYGEECPECEPVQADDVIQRVAELQLAAFLAGRGSIRTKDNGRTHVSLSGPTMDDYRRMAIAVMKGPKL